MAQEQQPRKSQSHLRRMILMKKRRTRRNHSMIIERDDKRTPRNSNINGRIIFRSICVVANRQRARIKIESHASLSVPSAKALKYNTTSMVRDGSSLVWKAATEYIKPSKKQLPVYSLCIRMQQLQKPLWLISSTARVEHLRLGSTIQTTICRKTTERSHRPLG